MALSRYFVSLRYRYSAFCTTFARDFTLPLSVVLRYLRQVCGRWMSIRGVVPGSCPGATPFVGQARGGLLSRLSVASDRMTSMSAASRRTDEHGRRVPRPTIRFLSLLPDDSFSNPNDLKALRAGRWHEISIGSIRHPLIDDAIKRFAQGLPDKHRSTSRAAQQPVYEVRSKTGAAWRGAVVLDEHGDPWLVFAAKHDQFHVLAQQALKQSQMHHWVPKAAEYKLRAREEDECKRQEWKRCAIAAVLDALADAANCPEATAAAAIPGLSSGAKPLRVEVSMEHDAPLEEPERNQSVATVFLRVASHEQEKLRDELLACVLPVLQPDSARIDSTFRRDGQLEVWVELTHAKVAQLAALKQAGVGREHLDATGVPNTHLHYVSSQILTEALVVGKCARAICGLWFVPTQDQSADLSICPECETQKPMADLVAQIIRRSRL